MKNKNSLISQYLIFSIVITGSFLFFGIGKASAANCGAAGSTYYVANAPLGSDSNNGTSAATPWAHHPWDTNHSGNSNCALQAGDTVIMRRGDTWYNVYMIGAQGGTSGNQITTTSSNTFYAVSPSDAYPTLSGAYNPASLTWTQDGANNDWYVAGTNPVPTLPQIVLYNNLILASVGSQALVQSTSNSFWYNSTTETVYANIGGSNPASGTLEIAHQNYVFLGTTTGYQTLSYLHLRVTNSTAGGVIFNDAVNNVIFDHLVVDGYFKYAIYQYSSTGDQVTNSTISNGTSTSVYGLYASSTNGIIITGNTVSGSATGYGIYVTGSTSATISNNTADNNYEGIELTGASAGFTIYHNTVYNNQGQGLMIASSNNGTANNNTIYGNDISTSGAGLEFSSTSSSSIYSNNVYNNSHGYYPSGYGSGIVIVGSSASNTIYNNISTSNYLGIEIAPSSGVDGNVVSDNIVQNSTVNGIDIEGSGSGYDMVYNNTIIHNPSPNNTAAYTGHGMSCQLSCLKAKFANNIVYIMQSGSNNQGFAIAGSFTSVYVDNNLLYDATAGGNGDIGQLSGVMYTAAQESAWKTALQGNGHIFGMDGAQANAESHELINNPLFVSASDFHLQNTSPAINAGANSVWSGTPNITDYESNPITNGAGTIVASGGTVDIGAYEFQDSTPPTTTADLAAGTYNSAQTVHLTCSDGAGVGCANTYYTIDGSTPTTGSTVYSDHIDISSTTTLKFFSQDKSLNSETYQTNIYTIDTTPPIGGSFTINSGAAQTKSTNVTLNITCPTDTWTPIQMAYGNSGSPANWTTCTSSQAHTLASGDGTKTVYVRFEDGGGNATGDSTQTITLDTTPPHVSITAPLTGNETNGNTAITFTDDDPHSPLCSPDNSHWTACVSNTTKIQDLTGWNSVSEGSFTLYLEDTDTAGNTGTNNLTLTKDTVAPTITITNPTTTPAQSKTITASATESATLSYHANNSGVTTCDGTLSFTAYSSITFSSESDNNKTVCYQAVDSANNTSYSLSSAIAGIDTTAPTLAFTDDVAIGPTQSDTITADWGDSSVAKWKYNDDTICSTTASDYPYTSASPMTQTTETNNGKYLCLYGEDIAGNQTTLSSNHPINIDTTPPVLSNPQDIGLVNTSTPSFTFNSTEGGTISYNGSCSSATTTGVENSNLVIFSSLPDGTYDDCQLRITDVATNQSAWLDVPAFTVDTTPPTISDNGSSAGELSSETTTATLSLITTEDAICQYSTLPDTPLANMTGDFDTTGNTTHTKTVSNLSAGTDYRYYVKCIDLADNITPDDFLISFSIASPASSSHKSHHSRPKKKSKPKYTTEKTNSVIHNGETITPTGKRFSKNSLVLLYFSKSNGVFYLYKRLQTDANGNFSVSLWVNKPTGFYGWYAIDQKTGKKSSVRHYAVR